MPHSLRRIHSPSVLTALAILLAACGSEDDPAQSAATPPPPPVANMAPTISGTPATTAVPGQAYSFTPTASDANGDPLSFTASNLPAWAALSPTTGVVTGTAAAGTFNNIVVSVSDGQMTTSLAAFSITVQAPPAGNTPPTISGTPATTATVGVAYSFQPTANDADGNTLTFSITGRPTWATFTATTGRLNGTPTAAGPFNNIVISVSDGQVTRSLPAFGITVAAATPTNRPPTISGSPATTWLQGRAYVFAPSASDPDGNTLTYSATNLPTWASLSGSTGRLTGTPTLGTYSGITISVSDGTASAALAPFTLNIVATAAGSATLSWTAPTTNTDNSALTDLAGFKLYWGPSPGNYTDNITLNGVGTLTYVVDNLTAGTWYFSAKSFNTPGTDSVASNEASKVVQ